MRAPLVFALLAYSWLSVAQTKAIDSLQTELTSAQGETKIQVLIDLCWEYRFINADSARTYGVEALELARKSKQPPSKKVALKYIGHSPLKTVE